MGYRLKLTKQAEKDAKKLEQAGLDQKARSLLIMIKENPYQNPPSYEKLKGDLEGAYSRRINIQHRLVYEVIKEQEIIKIISMWIHYE